MAVIPDPAGELSALPKIP